MNGMTGVMPYATGGFSNDLTSLNGIAGTNTYGGGSYMTPFMGGIYGNTSVTDVEGVKNNIANQYDIYATQQSYQGRQATEAMSQAERANNMATMLRSGRPQDAMVQFDTLCSELKSTPQYANYSDSQIKAIATKVYQNATGQDIRSDIENNSTGSFAKGLWEGIPIIGTFFSDNTSKEDLIAHVTDTPVRAADQTAKTLGAATSGAAAGALAFCWTGPIGAGIAAGVGALIGIVKSFTPTK